jgi:hypothetical protein
MKIRFAPLLAVTGLALSFTSCVNERGQFTPPDPIGRAIFGAIRNDPGYSDDYYEYNQPREVVVTTVRPRPIYERRPTVIPSGYRDPVYIQGSYAYTGGNWNWQRGRYVNRPRPGVSYYPSRYSTRAGRGYYRGGYWR